MSRAWYDRARDNFMLIESLFLHAQRQPEALAIIDDQGKCSYRQLAGMAAGFAKYISAQTNAARVGLLLPSGRGFVASFYGTLLAGKAVVPINFLLGGAEIGHCIRDSGIDTVVTIPQLAGAVEKTGLKIIDLTRLPPAPAPTAGQSCHPFHPLTRTPWQC